jgi:putative hydrolase of the HAD superfamily
MLRVKNVVFDLGAVLLNIDPQKSIEAFRRLLRPGRKWEEGWRMSLDAIRALEDGSISDSVFLNNLREILDPSLDDEVLVDAWNAILLDFPPERITMLQRLKPHYRLFLLSNSNHIHFQKYEADLKQQERGGFEALFEGLVFSYREGCAKPDPEIYRILLHRYGLEASETLFIDDREDNIEAAGREGILAFHLKDGMEVTTLFTEDGHINNDNLAAQR